MSEETMNSDDSYSDDDEEEELDPRIQDELEKLNAATNSINHLEAELDEARAVFRQTLAGATYHLNGIAHKLGKCVEKSRPFYESYRQLRQSHSLLQKSANQFERATGMHVAARTRVFEAEKRVFGAGAKRGFDSAIQEMLNQATIEVNEAEKMKRESWKEHQEDLKAYRSLALKVKTLYKKLKSAVDKAKPYFEQKREFDRHLWQLKLRVDSILLGLSGAKENYSACLKSLEIISDEIHEKRKSKRMEAMLSKLQEREAGVGADSSTEEETSLSASNLDLDFDSSLNFDRLVGDITDKDWSAVSSSTDTKGMAESNTRCEINDTMNPSNDTRVVYGLESPQDDSNVADAPIQKDEPKATLSDNTPLKNNRTDADETLSTTDKESSVDKIDEENQQTATHQGDGVSLDQEKVEPVPQNTEQPLEQMTKDEESECNHQESSVDKIDEENQQTATHQGDGVSLDQEKVEPVPQNTEQPLEQMTKDEESECNHQESSVDKIDEENQQTATHQGDGVSLDQEKVEPVPQNTEQPLEQMTKDEESECNHQESPVDKIDEENQQTATHQGDGVSLDQEKVEPVPQNTEQPLEQMTKDEESECSHAKDRMSHKEQDSGTLPESDHTYESDVIDQDTILPPLEKLEEEEPTSKPKSSHVEESQENTTKPATDK